jgi:hypothetical protein
MIKWAITTDKYAIGYGRVLDLNICYEVVSTELSEPSGSTFGFCLYQDDDELALPMVSTVDECKAQAPEAFRRYLESLRATIDEALATDA